MTLENAQVISRGNAVELSVLAQQGVALVKIDCQDKATVNLLSSAVMQEIEAVVRILNGDTTTELPPIHGVVFYSGKPNCFVAGADIKEIQLAQQMEIDQVYEACQKGKAILDSISALPMRTVCAVNGRCLGGGMEMFLRFGYRIASDNKTTVFGLPEVGLGVIPGWGGCILMPQLVGFKSAMSMILDPLHPWSAKRAHAEGVVNELVSEDRLLARAIEVAVGGEEAKPCKPSFMAGLSRNCFDSKLGRMFSSTLAGLLVKMKLGGRNEFPAPFEALDLMEAVFSRPGCQSTLMSLESGRFATLSHTKGCQRGVERFLEHQAKKSKKSEAKS